MFKFILRKYHILFYFLVTTVVSRSIFNLFGVDNKTLKNYSQDRGKIPVFTATGDPAPRGTTKRYRYNPYETGRDRPLSVRCNPGRGLSKRNRGVADRREKTYFESVADE